MINRLIINKLLDNCEKHTAKWRIPIASLHQTSDKKPEICHLLPEMKKGYVLRWLNASIFNYLAQNESNYYLIRLLKHLLIDPFLTYKLLQIEIVNLTSNVVGRDNNELFCLTNNPKHKYLFYKDPKTVNLFTREAEY